MGGGGKCSAPVGYVPTWGLIARIVHSGALSNRPGLDSVFATDLRSSTMLSLLNWAACALSWWTCFWKEGRANEGSWHGNLT